MEPPKEISLAPYSAEVLDPKILPWPKVGEELMKIEDGAFGKEEAFDSEMVKKFYEDKNNVFVVIRNPAGRAIGYTVSTPIYNLEVPEHHNPKQRVNDTDTAYIMSTAIIPRYQGRKLISLLIQALEDELKKRGYRYLERDSAISNGYADKILRHYGDRVIAWYDREDKKYGAQRSFHIRL